MTEQIVLKPGESIKPKITLEECKNLVKNLYGLKCTFIEELNGYDDRNYKVLVSKEVQNVNIEHLCEEGYVLKILNSLDSKKSDSIEAQTSLLIFLNENFINCPKPVKNKFGLYFSKESLESGIHIVRLLEFIPGKILHQIPQLDEELLFEFGAFVANMDITMQKFCHPAYKSYKSIWMLDSTPSLKQFLFVIKEEERQVIFKNIIQAFEEEVLSKRQELEKGMIHGDINEQNLVVDRNKNGKWFIKAILDFGDSHFSCYLFEIAIAMTYMMIMSKDLNAGGYVLAGYSKTKKISELELSLLKVCIETRLTQSLVLGAYSFLNDPGNNYILTTAKEGWNLLKQLQREPQEKLLKNWRSIMDNYRI